MGRHLDVGRGRRAGGQLAQAGVEADNAVGVGVEQRPDPRQRSENHHLDAQLLAQLTDDAGLHRLPRFDLAAGELLSPLEDGAGGPAGEKGLAFDTLTEP